MTWSARRGLALPVVISILGVSAGLAICFITLTRLERRASQQRIHATRALLLARSGIEDVLARIRVGQDPWMPSEVWRDGRLDASPLGTYALRIEGGGFHLNGGDPAQAAALGYNAVLRRMLGTLAEAVDRETTPRRGVLTESDGWSLLDARPAEGWKDFDQVRRLALGDSRAKLDLLKPYLCLHAWVDRKVIRPTATVALADRAFQSWAEIRQGKGDMRTNPAAAPTRSPPDFERVGTRLVGRAPVDLAWARRHRPALLALMAGLQGLYLGERSCQPMAEQDGLPATDCVGHLRTAEIRLVWDTPNDCETAADCVLACPDPLDTWEDWDRFCGGVPFPDAVARAALDGAGADSSYAAALTLYQDARAAEGAARAQYDAALNREAWAQQELETAQADLELAEFMEDPGWIARARARRDAAQQALTEAQAAVEPPRTAWEQARDALAQAKAVLDAAQARREKVWDGADVEEACRAILKANFNPNSDLNKFNPNATQWKMVDKSDLLQYSTEFSLQPLGALRVSSTGRVLDATGGLLARQEMEAELGGPSVLRLTTQAEFVAGDLGDPAVAGDERAFRAPSAPLYLGRGNGLLRTWGKGFLPDPAEKGLALQSYPEPYVAPGPAIRPADFDGSLQLATVETETDASFGQAGGRMTCLARFDDAFDLDRPATPALARCRPDALLATGPALLSRSVLDRDLPGTLYPDGAYSERDREPAYLSLLNMPPRHGLLSFWVKPNYDFSRSRPLHPPREQTRRGHLLFLANRCRISGMASNQPDTQAFVLCQGATEGLGEVLGAFFEINCQMNGFPEDEDREHEYALADPFPPRQWRLVSFAWDFETEGPGSADTAGELVLDGTRAASGDLYRSSIQNVGAHAQNLTGAGAENFAYSGAGGAHRFVLGGRMHEVELQAPWDICGSGADSTFDEFAIWDFGRDASNAIARGLAAARHADGRYYAGTAYTRYGEVPPADRAPEWTSAPILLPPGSRLEAVSWTLSPAMGYWLELELLSADGSGYLGGDETSSRSGNVGAGQTWALSRVPGAFRAHAVFRRDAAPASLLDTPRLDDLSFVYTPAGGRPVLAWDRK